MYDSSERIETASILEKLLCFADSPDDTGAEA
jgi:hypothetical protein